MAKFNISQAAKLYSKDRSSVQRKIKQGKISYEVDGRGYKAIDLAELIREFGEPPNSDTVDTRVENETAQHVATVYDDTSLLLEKIVKDLEKRLEEVHREREREREEYRKREQWLQQKIDHMTLLLPDHTKKKGFWCGLFGR